MDRINYVYHDATIDCPWNDYVIDACVNGSSVQATESSIGGNWVSLQTLKYIIIRDHKRRSYSCRKIFLAV